MLLTSCNKRDPQPNALTNIDSVASACNKCDPQPNALINIHSVASAAIDNYIRALTIIDISEGQELYRKSQWLNYGFPGKRILDHSNIFESIFETDCAGVVGYKRLVERTFENSVGGILHDRIWIIAYPDRSTKQWKVFCHLPPDAINEESIEQDRLHTIEFPSVFNYQYLAECYGGAGKLRKAREACQKASEVFKTTPEKDRIQYSGNLSRTVKQEEIDACLEVLTRIIGS